MMPQYKATHIPYGVTDPSKRTIRNPGIKDEVEFLKYGIETGGEYFEVRAVVKPGGGEFSQYNDYLTLTYPQAYQFIAIMATEKPSFQSKAN